MEATRGPRQLYPRAHCCSLRTAPESSPWGIQGFTDETRSKLCKFGDLCRLHALHHPHAIKEKRRREVRDKLYSRVHCRTLRMAHERWPGGTSGHTNKTRSSRGNLAPMSSASWKKGGDARPVTILLSRALSGYTHSAREMTRENPESH